MRKNSGIKYDIAAPFLGVTLTSTYAPFDYGWLAIIVLALTLAGWQQVSPRRAALRGFLFGVGLFGSGTYWVYISVHDFGGAPALGAGLLTIFFALFWALFPALSAYLSARLGSVKSFFAVAANMAAIWILVEYFRGYVLLNGFPWLQVSYSQLETPLSGYVPVLGGYGCGYLLIFSAVLLASYPSAEFRDRVKMILILSSVWGGGWLLQSIHWTAPAGEPIEVTLIQGNVSQDKKWETAYRRQTLLDYRELTAQHWNSDIVIWPETAIPAYRRQVQQFYLGPLEEAAKRHQTDIIVGIPAKGETSDAYYNMALTLGRTPGEYKKNHLLPFGEYLPLQPLSGWVLGILQIELGNFLPGGDQQPLMVAGGYPYAMSICYEDAFAKVFVDKLPQAAYLVNITNDAWFGDSLEPHQHMQMARMRAMESGRFLLRATNTGLTGIVDSHGKLTRQAPLFEQTTLTGSILPMQGSTPFVLLGGDGWVIALCVLAIVLTWLANASTIKKMKVGRKK